MRLITQNLVKFVESREYSDRTFEQLVGWSNGFYGKVRAGKIAFSIDKLRSIVDAFPELNIHWLCTGSGEMYLSVSQQKQMGVSKHSVCHDLESEMQLLNEEDKKEVEAILNGLLGILKNKNKPNQQCL